MGVQSVTTAAPTISQLSHFQHMMGWPTASSSPLLSYCSGGTQPVPDPSQACTSPGTWMPSAMAEAQTVFR